MAKNAVLFLNLLITGTVSAMKQTRKLRSHILSMRINDVEWGVVQNCAEQKGVRVSEVMRDALRMYMQRSVEHTVKKGV